MGPSDRTAGNFVPTLQAKSNAGDTADVILWADPTTHRLLVNGLFTGALTNNNAAPGATNIGALVALANAAAPSYTEGNQVLLSVDLTGALRVASSGGGTSMTDDAAFTPGTTAITPMGAMFDDVAPDSVNEGDGGVVRMSANRNLYVNIRDAAGNERGLNIAADGSLAITVASIPSHAVTNAGTFVVQENGAALTALQLLDDAIVTDDAAFTPATTKVMMAGFEYDDTTPDSVNEGDAGAARMSANRNQYVQIRDNAGNERGLNIDASGQIAVTIASAQTLATVTTVGTVTAMGVGTSGPMKAEDVAHATGDMGFAVWTVRQDTLATTAANGDYVPFSTDSIGALYTRDTATQLDDAAFTPATGRILPIGFLVDDTATDSVDEGDAGIPRMSADRIIYVQGALANDAVDAGNPLKIGGQARTTNPTAVADADRVNFIADKLGKQVVVGSIRDLKTTQATTITSSTSETTVLTAVASTFLDVYGVIVTNSSATQTEVTFKDSTAGTTRFVIAVPAGDTRGFMVNESAAHPQATVNTNWTATCADSVASILITMMAVKNT